MEGKTYGGRYAMGREREATHRGCEVSLTVRAAVTAEATITATVKRADEVNEVLRVERAYHEYGVLNLCPRKLRSQTLFLFVKREGERERNFKGTKAPNGRWLAHQPDYEYPENAKANAVGVGCVRCARAHLPFRSGARNPGEWARARMHILACTMSRDNSTRACARRLK